MGTRSLIRFVYEKRHVVDIYAQYDGHFESRGKQLAYFIAGGKIINGFGSDAKTGTHFNGFSDLVAQWIAYEKGDKVGNIYIHSRETKEEIRNSWYEYIYVVTGSNTGTPQIKAYTLGRYLKNKPNFAGSAKDYLEWDMKEDEE